MTWAEDMEVDVDNFALKAMEGILYFSGIGGGGGGGMLKVGRGIRLIPWAGFVGRPLEMDEEDG